MRTWTIGLVVATSVAAGAALTVNAQEQMVVRRHAGPMAGIAPHRPMGPPLGHLEQVLKLTDDQKTALKAVHEEQRQAAEPLLQQVRAHHEAVRAALEAGQADPATIGREVIAAHEVEKQLDELHRAVREKLIALLTDEQRQALEAFEKEHGPMPGPGIRMRMMGPKHVAPQQ